jgi:hypothetical protein
MHKTNTMAIVSLVSGLIAWFMAPILASIVAIITGHMARKQIRASGGLETGDGMAIAGLVLGYLSLLIGVLGLIFAVLVFFGVLGLGFLGAIFGSVA